jgi:hypothetical protein
MTIPVRPPRGVHESRGTPRIGPIAPPRTPLGIRSVQPPFGFERGVCGAPAGVPPSRGVGEVGYESGPVDGAVAVVVEGALAVAASVEEDGLLCGCVREAGWVADQAASCWSAVCAVRGAVAGAAWCTTAGALACRATGCITGTAAA